MYILFWTTQDYTQDKRGQPCQNPECCSTLMLTMQTKLLSAWSLIPQQLEHTLQSPSSWKRTTPPVWRSRGTIPHRRPMLNRRVSHGSSTPSRDVRYSVGADLIYPKALIRCFFFFTTQWQVSFSLEEVTSMQSLLPQGRCVRQIQEILQVQLPSSENVLTEGLQCSMLANHCFSLWRPKTGFLVTLDWMIFNVPL